MLSKPRLFLKPVKTSTISVYLRLQIIPQLLIYPQERDQTPDRYRMVYSTVALFLHKYISVLVGGHTLYPFPLTRIVVHGLTTRKILVKHY